MILWEVNMKWANKGRQGETNCVVFAADAVTALQKAWYPEDVKDLRDVTVRWLAPLGCVIAIENADRFCNELKESE